MSGPAARFDGITIDPPGSRDLDDAIHVERSPGGWTVRVGIPYVGNRVERGSGPDARAEERGATRYSGASVRESMLPPDAAEALSLMPGGDRDIVLISVPVGHDLAAGVPSVGRATFASAGRLSYAEATAAIGDAGNVHHSMLVEAGRLAAGLARRRASTGALGLRDIGGGMSTDEEGRIVPSLPDAGPAEEIVREVMILANASLAAFCASADLPILYRNHRPNAVASREALAEDLALAGRGLAPVDTLAERISLVVGRARLGPCVEGHWGLDLPAYAWFTSPIRRYADIVNQRVLLAHVEGKPSPYAADVLAAMAGRLNATDDARRDATAAFLKAGAAKRAVSLISKGRLASAGASDFTGILKACTVDGPMQESVAEEALLRLGAGRLTTKDAARLLLAKDGPAAAVMAHFLGAPHEAVALLNYAEQGMGWGKLRTEVVSAGQSPDEVFTAVAHVEAEGRSHASPPCQGRNRKEAIQAASVRLLASVAGVPVPAPPSLATAHAKAAKPVPPPDMTTPRNVVQDICQRRRWPLPQVSVRREGPPHEPTFTASASASDGKGRTWTGPERTGRSRKDAERDAFAALIPLIPS